MAIANEKFGFTLLDDTTGLPKTGQLVELKVGASTYVLTEIATSGYYKIDSIPTGKYSVYVNSVDTQHTFGVGTGQVAALGNELDSIPVSAASAYSFQDPTTLKTTLSLDEVNNVAVPVAIPSDQNKVLSVNASGKYTLVTPTSTGFVAVFEANTASELQFALEAVYLDKIILNTKAGGYKYLSNKTITVYGRNRIYGADFNLSCDVGITADFLRFDTSAVLYFYCALYIGSAGDFTGSIEPQTFSRITNITAGSVIDGPSVFTYESIVNPFTNTGTKTIQQGIWDSTTPSPTTTLGDIIFNGGSGDVRYGIGTVGQVLTSDGTVPQWATPSGGGSQDLESVTTIGNTTTKGVGLRSGFVASVDGDLSVSSDGSIYGFTEGSLSKLIGFRNSNFGGTNLNTYENGIIRVTNIGTGYSNIPTELVGVSVQVIIHTYINRTTTTPSYGTQEIRVLNSSNMVYIRNINNSTWTTWTPIDTSYEDFGLGAQTISAETNLNNYPAGSILVTPNGGLTNLPPTFTQGRLVVSTFGGVNYGGQMCFNSSDNNGKVAVRTFASTWSSWFVLGSGGGTGSWTLATEPTNISAKAGFRPIRYRDNGLGQTEIEGAWAYDVGYFLGVGASVTLFTLPLAYRPDSAYIFYAVVRYNGSYQCLDCVSVKINTDGTVVMTNGNGSAVSSAYTFSLKFQFGLT
jgi:hypothetical protein